MRSRRVLAAVLCAVSVVALLLPAAPASAAAAVSVTSSLGKARAAATGSTTVTVTGSGFQSIQGGFGGIYVVFGWVKDPSGGSWRPSKGGHTGTDLLYVPDSETKSNAGYQKFVSFPGSSTEDSANGGELSTTGTFSLTLVIPGPTFTTQDATGASRTIDCRSVGCGVITIGAHGVTNATNETFTPVTFAAATTASATAAAASAAGTTSAAAPTASAEGELATVGLGQQTYQAGRIVSFTGQGFAPGEQVVASLSAGLAAAGPLTAGKFGEVAGTLTLPSDIRAGTHVVRLSGAGSGRVAEASISVMADATTTTAATPTYSVWRTYATVAVVTATGLLLVLIVASLVTALARRRGAGRTRVRRRKVPSVAPVEETGQ